MTEVYRFRSAKQLLEEPYQELQRETIYFASPEQLNDPMEGFRDFVWSGDKVVWTNLFKHYVYCLLWAYQDVSIFGNQIVWEADRVAIWAQWNEPPTPQMGELFNEIWNRINKERRLSELAEKIATTRNKVRFNELVFYLDSIHLQAIEKIHQIYVERGLMAEMEVEESKANLREYNLVDTDFFELMSEAEVERKNFSEVMFLVSYHMRVNRTLKYKYESRNSSKDTFERNRQMLFLDFPTIYVNQLERILWPEWYAACFSRSYSNSSSWASYGDSHRGACLIFEANETGDGTTLALEQMTGWGSTPTHGYREHWNVLPMRFDNISYSVKSEEIDFFRNLGMLTTAALKKLWYTDEAGSISDCAAHIETAIDLNDWREKHWADYKRDIVVKSKDWEHEQECRLILNGGLEASLDDHHRTLKYEFASLKGIIFAIKTSTEHKIRIIETIQAKCQMHGRDEFKFYQAYYSPQDGDIRKHEISLT